MVRSCKLPGQEKIEVDERSLRCAHFVEWKCGEELDEVESEALYKFCEGGLSSAHVELCNSRTLVGLCQAVLQGAQGDSGFV